MDTNIMDTLQENGKKGSDKEEEEDDLVKDIEELEKEEETKVKVEDIKVLCCR